MPTPSQINAKKREEKYYPPKELKAEIKSYCRANKISASKFTVELLKQFFKERERRK